MIPLAACTAAVTPNAFYWTGLSPELPLPVKRSEPQLVHSSLDPHESAPKTASIGSAVFAQLTRVPNTQMLRQTDRQTCIQAMSPQNEKK